MTTSMFQTWIEASVDLILMLLWAVVAGCRFLLLLAACFLYAATRQLHGGMPHIIDKLHLLAAKQQTARLARLTGYAQDAGRHAKH